MANSHLEPVSSNPPEVPSGSGQGSPFPFAWRSPSIQGPETVITTQRSQPSANPPEMTFDPLPDQTRRLFPSTTDIDDVAGVRIGHFTIQRRIGMGGMGSVFLANDERLRRSVALKILAPSLTVDPASVQRFQNEARAAARLDHDNIARVFFYGEDAGLHYIAYEYIPGSNLRDVIRLKGKLDPAEAVNYTMQLAAALNHTSAAGVVHRDIKPSNILITPQKRAKLVDLGLARRESLEASAALTVAGTTLGTFDYISPEQAKDPRNVDVRSDIYSLGCTLYHMLTGEPPYPEGTVLQKLLDHHGKEAPNPARKNRRVSPALSAVVRRMMASDPRRRYANPGDLLRDLLHVARSLGSGAVPIDGQVWLTATHVSQPTWQRNIGWLVTASSLVLLVVVMERYPWLVQRFDPRPSAVSGTRGINNATANSHSAVEGPSLPSQSTVDIDQPQSEFPVASGRPALPKPNSFQHDQILGMALGPQIDEESDGVGASGRSIRTSLIDPELFHLRSGEPSAFPPLLSESSSNRLNGLDGNSGQMPTGSDAGPGIDEKPVLAVTRTPAASAAQPAEVIAQNDSKQVISMLDGKVYQSLEAACAEAKDGSIIELRYNGRRSDSERPIRLSNKKNIIVRGGIGFRPQIVFAPFESPSDATQSRMLTVTGGSLEIVNVDITFSIPGQFTSDCWALFSLERPEKLQLHGVTITVENPNSQPACVVEQLAATGQGLGNVGMMKDGMPAEPPKVSISESLVRGECDLILQRAAVPVRFQMKDALLAVQGAIYRAVCQSELPNAETDRVTLEIEHSTCLYSEGLVITEGVDNQTDRTPSMLVIARNNILSCSNDRPLVTMKDSVDLMEMKSRFVWNGDRNFYDSQQIFWQLGGRQSPALSRQFDLDAWRNYWGGNEGASSSNAAIVWRTKPFDRPWTKMSAEAVELNGMAASNPAVNGASDGKDAGVTLSKLPPLPVDERDSTEDTLNDSE